LEGRVVSKIAIIGLGYVGLTTALGLAKLGHEVIGVDTNLSRLETLRSGKLPIHEPGLDVELRESIDKGLLTFSSDPSGATESCEIFFVCVSTPSGESGAADLSIVFAVCADLSKSARPNSIIVLKSTVPVGTGEKLSLATHREDLTYASNPEFLREGSALEDFMKPDRIVVGASSKQVADRILSLYDAIEAPKISTSVKSAELIKYASNAYLASRLSFVNDLAALCEQVGANVDDVVRGMGADSRIGPRFLSPGPGWGGSCFPKDTRALVHVARENNVDLGVVQGAIEANDKAFDRVLSRLTELLPNDATPKTIAVLGIAFKANTDDIRDSPALEVIQRILSVGHKVRAFDPIALAPDIDGLIQTSTAIEAATDADALLVLTEWQEFSEIDPVSVSKAMKGSVVLDTRRILPRELWELSFESFKVLGVGSN
jgi:UDPglucose 6-dehydrogenase